MGIRYGNFYFYFFCGRNIISNFVADNASGTLARLLVDCAQCPHVECGSTKERDVSGSNFWLEIENVHDTNK